MREPDRHLRVTRRTMKPGPRFEVGKPFLQFDCKWGVYTRNGNTSVCYTTDRDRAQLIADALNAYSPNSVICVKNGS